MRVYVCVYELVFNTALKFGPNVSVFVTDGLKGTGVIFGLGVCGLCLRSLLFCKNIKH